MDAAPLQGAVYLEAPDESYSLFAARVLIGRAPHCRVILRDSHVSREHARIHITPVNVMIENLMSVNGVYVNGRRVYDPQPLYSYDQILLGTTELNAYAIDEQPRTRVRLGPDSSGSDWSGRDRPGSDGSGSDGSTRGGCELTYRDEALGMLGRVANRMFGQGRPAEAEIVLSDHLENLLDGIRSGTQVSGETCENAAHFALMLALNLRKGLWVEYAIELHLSTHRPLSRPTAALLEAALEVTHDLNDHWVLGSLTTMGPNAHEILRRLRG